MNTTAQADSRQMEQGSRRRFLLFPKEHGAYGQLIFPALTALLLGVRFEGAGLALAFALVFLLHEPVVVLLGHRGQRARQQFSTLARRQCTFLSLLTAAVMMGIWPRLRPEAQWAVLVPAAAASIMGVFILTGKERTTTGELVAAAGLSSCSLPIAVADGSTWAAAGICWLIWAAVLMAATLSVRGVIAGAKQGETTLSKAAVVLGAIGVALTAILIKRFELPPILLLAAAPAVLFPAVIVAVRPSPKYLRRIGWSALTSDFAIVILMVAALRP